VEQIGTPEELYFKPRSIFAADFVGDSNLIDVTIDEPMASGDRQLIGPEGCRLVASGTDAFEKGQRAHLMVRPESLRRLNPGEAATNVLHGVVCEGVFVGSVYKYGLQLVGGTRIWGKHQSYDASDRPKVGDALTVGWTATAGVLLPGSKA
jgi:putative spermidine/putrescine transport system ATP-binding protein